MAVNTENLLLVAWGIQAYKSPCQLGLLKDSNAVGYNIMYVEHKERKRQYEVILNFYLGCLPLLTEVHMCLLSLGLSSLAEAWGVVGRDDRRKTLSATVSL